MNAREILDLLGVRHSKDLFVPECKDGPTHGAQHVRLDAWAMARSWANPRMTGYEIKVSRADWLSDQKVERYLPLCNCLYVVAPKGVALVDELPTGVGLLHPSSTGSRLMTGRKAAYREIEPPVDLLYYILMCRTRIEAASRYEPEAREQRAARWAEAVERRRVYRDMGHTMSKALRAEVRDLVENAEARAREAERRANALEGAARILSDLGISTNGGQWVVRRRIEALRDPARALRETLRHALEELEGLCEQGS